MKKITLILILLLLCACQTKVGSNQADFAWQIQSKDFKIINSLIDQATVTHYDGSSEVVTITHKANSGQTYVLILINIIKAKAGGNAFEWDKLHLTDEDGHAYPRIDDDFLTQHNYDRLPGIQLRLGTHEGWIVFEIPLTASKGDLRLIYQADEGDNMVLIKP